ncbi:hypothetical protein EMCRGX_G030615 [Ephydatia muelleri]
MYDVIEKTVASAEANSNIGQAITYECIRTATSIYPNSALIEKVSHSVARLLVTPNNNWRYLGIQALSQLVQVNPKYALDHQLVVIDCLDDVDETLKRKTLDLLFKMTNPRNVTTISEKLISYLRTTTDDYIRADLVSKITQLAERFAPDNLWFIQTMNSVFELGGGLVRKEVAHNLMRLLAEGTDDEEADAELRADAVASYIEMLDKPNIPDVLVQIIAWVVSEYNYVLEGEVDLEELLEKMTSLLHRKFQDPTTYSWVVSAITKMVAQLGRMSDIVHSQLILHLSSVHTDIQQRCSELMQLNKEMVLIQKVLPLDSACEDLEVDSSLSFLDDYVAMALSRGKSPYKPASQRMETVTVKELPKSAGIKFQPYQLTTPSTVVTHLLPAAITTVPEPTTPTTLIRGQPAASAPTETLGVASGLTVPDSGIGLAAPKSRVWGKEGYKTKSNAQMLPVPVSAQEMPPSPRDGSGGVASLQLGNLTSSTTVPTVLESQVHAGKEALVNPQDQMKMNLANELFGGLTGPSKAPKARGDARGGSRAVLRESAPKQQPVQPAPKPQVDLLLDLGDIDFSQPAAPPPQPSSIQQMGLFGELTMRQPSMPVASVPFSKSTPSLPMATPAVPLQATPSVLLQPTKPAVQSVDLLDLMGSTPPTDHASSAASNIPSDFSFLNPQPPPPKQENPASLALSLFENPMGSLKIPTEYSRYPVVAGWDNKEVANDVRLRVSITKDQLSDVSFSLDVPTNLKTTNSSGAADLAVTSNIVAFGNIHHVFLITPISPAVNMSVRGQVSYKERGSPKKLFFDITLQVSDLIRPLTYTTEEFGRKWVGLTNEKKLKVDGSLVKKPSDFMDLVSKKLNFHPVQIIGSEAIAAGNFLPNMPCLVHGKLSATSVELWLRTSSGLLTDSIAKLAQSMLQN